MQLEEDEEFSEWSRKLAEEQAEEGQSVIYVNIKRLRELRSRIEELEVEQAA